MSLGHLREMKNDLEKETKILDEEISGLQYEHDCLMSQLDDLEEKKEELNERKDEIEEEIRDLDEKIRNEEFVQEMLEDHIYEELMAGGVDEMSAEIIAAEVSEDLNI